MNLSRVWHRLPLRLGCLIPFRPAIRLGNLVALVFLASALAGGVSVGFAEFARPAPPPPTGLSVVATQTSLTLSWNPMPLATGYGLYLDGGFVAATSGTSWTFGSLGCATTHLLQVDARYRHSTSSKAGINGTTSACQSKPPVNTALPVVSGSVVVGAVLSGSSGSWSGTGPFSFVYQWLRCNGSGSGCVSVSGASASSYTLVSADVGSTMRVRVTASNGVGSASAQSAATGVVQAGLRRVRLGRRRRGRRRIRRRWI